ncbi:MAG: hypothetical protein OEM81_07335 [Acidimicrobiia bacterium]|nr:hypothetical protein [Acidimicrobiia bacterium]
MMLRRRGPFGVFLMVGVGVLVGATLFGGSGAVGGLVAAPLLVLGFLFKIVLFFMLFGLVSRLFAGLGGRDKSWSGPSHEWWSDEVRSRRNGRSRSSESDVGKPQNDRFEEWHRMAHARQEVDDHTPPFEE